MPPRRRSYSHYDQLHRKSAHKLPFGVYVAIAVVSFLIFLLFDNL